MEHFRGYIQIMTNSKPTHKRAQGFNITHLLGAVRIVHEMAHGDKGVTQSFCRCDPFISIQTKHPLQEVYKLSSIGLLSQHVCPLQMRGQVDLETQKNMIG